VCIYHSVVTEHSRLHLVGKERHEEAGQCESVFLLDEGTLADLELVAGTVHYFWLL
jgi:hypothetical protein